MHGFSYDEATGAVEVVGHAVIDGGFATELVRLGVDVDSDELWSASCLIDKPGAIREVHELFYRAGADVGITASYQASFEGFAGRGFSKEKAAELMVLSVKLACEARDAVWAEVEQAGSNLNKTASSSRMRPLVAASVGPYGAILHNGSEYTGDYGGKTEQDLVAFHEPRLHVLADSGAEILAMETIPSVVEVRALLAALTAVNAKRRADGKVERRAWISMSCKDATHLNDGTDVAAAVALIDEHPHVFAVGTNCTVPEHIEGFLQTARKASKAGKNLLAYPNSGEIWDGHTHEWKRDPEAKEISAELEGGGSAGGHDGHGHGSHDGHGHGSGSAEAGINKMVGLWYRAGATMLGGCCRVTPASIQGIANALVEATAVSKKE